MRFGPESVPRLRFGLLWLLHLCLAMLGLAGCQAVVNPYDPRIEPPVPEAIAPGREMSKVSLPAYRIEPPDVISIEMLKLIPLPPYRAEVFDVLQIRANAPQDAPIDNYYLIEAEGTINLGPQYGSVRVPGMTIEEIRATLDKWLRQYLTDPSPSVQLARVSGAQPVTGQYLVGPDGTINLRQYGVVPIAGKTVTEARWPSRSTCSSSSTRPRWPWTCWPTTARSITSSRRGPGWATASAACR